MKLKTWLLEIRPPFLLLSIALVLLGTSISWHDGRFNWFKFLLTTLGLLLAHTSVNVLNDYYDFKSGIDFNTKRTPFSGGSGILTQGMIKSKSAYRFGVGCLVAAFPVGIYLSLVSGWQLLPLIFLGGAIIYFYTSYLTKWLIGEFFAGLGLGTLPVMGIYFIQTGGYSIEVLIASLAPGLLTANLLFLNEFPDYEADKKGGRYNLVIALGRKKAGQLYTGMMIMAYLSIILGVILKLIPVICLIALASIPFALKAITVSIRYSDDREKLIPAMKANIITVLGTDILLALAYLLA